MKTKPEIEKRLNGLHTKYQQVRCGVIDPELEAQIRELQWVLGGE